MWPTLRAELAYLRPWLLGGLGIALTLAALVSVIFAMFGGPTTWVAAAVRAMFPLGATLIVAFIAQAYRNDERRVVLLLAGPVTPRQLAMVSVLIPLALGVCGTVAAVLIVGVEAAITGTFAVETLHIVGYVGGQMFLYTLVGLLIREAVVSARQRRRVAAVTGWVTLFAVGSLLTLATITVFARQEQWTWPTLHAANLITAAVIMVVTVHLFTGRTDFTQ